MIGGATCTLLFILSEHSIPIHSCCWPMLISVTPRQSVLSGGLSNPIDQDLLVMDGIRFHARSTQQVYVTGTKTI